MVAIPGLSPLGSALVVATASLSAGLLVRWSLLALRGRVASRTRNPIDDVVATKLATPLGLAIAWVGALVALGPLATTDAQRLALERALPSGLIVLGAIALTRVALALVRDHAGHHHHRALLLAGRFAGFFIAIVVALTLLALWDVEVTPLLASAGIVGIALALAAQQSLSNVFAGIAIYLDKTYAMGDYIVLDQGDRRGQIRGEVVDVGLRSTRIRTRNDVVVIIPNTDIANARIVNESARQFHRIRASLVVDHASDLDQVEEALLAAARECHAVLDHPAPIVRFREILPEGIRVVILGWIDDPGGRGKAMHALVKAVHRSLSAAGVRLGAPTMVRASGR